MISRLGENNINGHIIGNSLNTGTSGEIHDHVFGPEILQCGGPLPFTHVGFGGKNANDHASLTWNTALELNFSYFEVESPADGQSRCTISSVVATGSSNTYNFTDMSVMNSGPNYYP